MNVLISVHSTLAFQSSSEYKFDVFIKHFSIPNQTKPQQSLAWNVIQTGRVPVLLPQSHLFQLRPCSREGRSCSSPYASYFILLLTVIQ